jgi:hypothetical protein
VDYTQDRGARTLPPRAVLVVILATLALAGTPDGRAMAQDIPGDGRPGGATHLVDDFVRDDGVSSLGTSWQRFTDQVMGGRSRAASVIEVLDGRRCLRLTGEVSLANNGGFIQVALPLAERGRVLEAQGWTGLRLLVRGAGDGYYLHLRTADCRLPWQYYDVELPCGPQWSEVEIAFADFQPRSLGAALDLSGLQRLGVVAGKKAFTADIAVARIELYR